MKISKIIQNLITVILALAALLIIISLFPVTGNYKILVVQSGSMEPAIKTGSVVIVKPADNYQTNDVITFAGKDGGKSTTHRIVKIETENGETHFVTKGDANNTEDNNKVTADKIIGKVLFSIPYAGYAVAAAKEPLGFALLVIVPAGLIIIEEIGKIRGELKKKKEKKEDENTEFTL